MKKPLIKICGITNYDDGLACMEGGADLLGFIFYDKSPRYVNPETAGDIIARLKEKFNFISVGVFVNPSEDYVKDIIKKTGIDILQFHGEEPSSFIKKFHKKAIKAFRIKDKKDTDKCLEYKDIDYFLFDAFSENQYGGTGRSFDWNILSDFKLRQKLFLSGGISTENIQSAVKTVKPRAIDISSSLEKEPGKKDKNKIKEFFLRLNNYFC